MWLTTVKLAAQLVYHTTMRRVALRFIHANNSDSTLGATRTPDSGIIHQRAHTRTDHTRQKIVVDSTEPKISPHTVHTL